MHCIRLQEYYGSSEVSQMNTCLSFIRNVVGRALFFGVLLGAWTAAGAGVPIPNVPLFIGNNVPANIFLILDDSGSMGWELLLRPEAVTIHSTYLGFRERDNLDFTPELKTRDREHCPGYNVMAYNPDVVYTPWLGVDSEGVPFQNQTIGAARVDPYSSASTTNLLRVDHRSSPSTDYSALYGIWTDNDGDGEYDLGECPAGLTSSTVTSFRGRVDNGYFNDERFIFINTLSPEEQTNYANWYTYYRKRVFVLKRAISELISNSQQRMGLATLWNNHNVDELGVGTPVAFMTDPIAKNHLLTQLFRVKPSGETPLQRALDMVGHYFDQTDSGTALHSGLGFSDDSPILLSGEGGECQQNFTVLFSDGYWNATDTIPEVGNTDGDGNTDFDGGATTDLFNNTLADVAMNYYERDLAPTMANSVPMITGVDENNTQHLVTYTVSFGLNGTLSASPPNYDSTTLPPPWPRPRAGESTTTDDMRHAAFNARGKFLSGQDPQELIRTLNDAFADIAARMGTAAAVSATSQALRTGTLIFSGVFETSNWSGRLYAQRFLSSGVIGETIWEASEHIPAAGDRNLFTWNDENSSGTGFLWANLTTAQQTAIGTEPILRYVRGDQTLELAEGGPYRTRASLLGDIIDSSPAAVTRDQSPRAYDRLPGAEGSSFLAFQASKQTRQDMVYVGANDGMLHGFRTDSGEEVMGYIPRATFPTLARLSEPSYEHRYYVDGGLFAGDAYINGDWKTVLLGSTGRGSPAIFALDVSLPTSFNENNVLWEFTHEDLGNITHKPLIARMNNGQWVAIFGNGYNSASETAQLFIVNLATGALIKQIDTGAGDADHSNGLGGPLLIDPNLDTNVDIIYAGDLLGNLWKFDVSSDDPEQWGIAEFSNDSGVPLPLYRAYGPDGEPQAISTTPTLAVHPQGGYQVLFGTGRYLATGDDLLDDPVKVDTFYGIRDTGAAVLDYVGSRPLPGAGTQPGDLLQPQQILIEDTQQFDDEDRPIGVLSANPVNYTPGPGQQSGWYLDLVSPATGSIGERVIADPIVLGGLVVFTTFAPVSDCASGGNTSALFALNAITGGRSTFTVFDINEDNAFDADDQAQLDDDTSEVVSMIRVGTSVAPVTLVASEDGNMIYGLTTDLNSGTGTDDDDDDDDDEEIDADDPDINRLRPPQDSIGRQSWRQLR